MSLQDKTSTIIIGDVHGCYFTLRNLLKQLPKNSQIIFIGDMCDLRFHYTATQPCH